MEIRKIRLTKVDTLNVTYKKDGDIIVFEGANIVHPDMRAAMKRLVPHLVIMTEQREWTAEVRSGSTDAEIDAPNMQVTEVTISGNAVTLVGTRLLESGYVIRVQSYRLDMENGCYPWSSDLSEAIENVKYEAEEFLKGKWGVRQQMLEFNDNPFEGIEAAEVTQVDISVGEGEKTA